MVSTKFASYSALWNRLSLNHRVLLILVAVGTVVAGVATVRWARQATYTTLYSDLAPAEAGEIVRVLSGMNVPYRISAGGTSLEVPESEAQAARLKLAARGYPRNGVVGYEIFDQTNVGSSSQLELRHSVENYLETKAQSLLDLTLGTGRSVVRVIADLNFDKVETSAEHFDPDRVAVRREEVQTAKPGAVGTGASQNATITNYEISKTVEHVVSAFGTIERLSVAVMVDGTYARPAGTVPDAAPTYQPRTHDELQQISAIVRTAVGFDSTRADHLEVVNMSFDTSMEEELASDRRSMEIRELSYDLGRKALYGVLFLGALLYVRRVIRKPGDATARTASGNAASPLPATPAGSGTDRPEASQRIRTTDLFGERARARPEEVAKIIKTMMSE